MKPDSTARNYIPRLIVIVADIGGPVALHNLLSELPADFRLPIVILLTSDPLLHESSISALQRTTPLKLHRAKSETDLRAGHVYFAISGRACSLNNTGQRLALKPDRADERWISSSISRFAEQLGASLTVVFLSGRGDDADTCPACSALEHHRCDTLVLSSAESVVSDLGRSVLAHHPAARELSAQQIIACLVTDQNKLAAPARQKAGRM